MKRARLGCLDTSHDEVRGLKVCELFGILSTDFRETHLKRRSKYQNHQGSKSSNHQPQFSMFDQLRGGARPGIAPSSTPSFPPLFPLLPPLFLLLCPLLPPPILPSVPPFLLPLLHPFLLPSFTLLSPFFPSPFPSIPPLPSLLFALQESSVFGEFKVFHLLS